MSSPNEPGLRVFNDAQRGELHSAALEVLERVGVEIRNERALGVAARAGAYVDGTRVRFPAALVEKCIRSAPSRVVLCDREGHRKLMLERYNFYFGPGATTTYTIDPVTGERRAPRVADTTRASRVIDALPNIDFQMDFGGLSDVDPSIMDLCAFEALLNSSVKPIVHWAYTARNCEAIIEMGVEVAGSLEALQANPFFVIYKEPVSPLMHESDALDVLMLMAENRLPVIYTGAPLGGATAPATLAGIIVMSLCESLSGLVIHQSVNPGAPFIMGGVAATLDMAAGEIVYGSPEFMLMAAGLSEMAHHYQMPMFSTAGCSDAKSCDGQQAAETAQNLLFAALSGGNLIHDCGYLESAQCSSLQALVIVDELIGQVKRLVRGIEVNEDTLALDVIAAAGPGGNFMKQRHTTRHYRSEWFFPGLIDRRRFQEWDKEGRLDLAARAQRRLLEILDGHAAGALDHSTRQRVHAIVERLQVTDAVN